MDGDSFCVKQVACGSVKTFTNVSLLHIFGCELACISTTAVKKELSASSKNNMQKENAFRLAQFSTDIAGAAE